MVHAAIAHAQPGDVLVLTMPDPFPVALIGDLLATQARAQGVAALLVDAAVRDVEELRELGLPVWARWIRVRGAAKDTPGTLDEPVEVGGQRIAAGDIVVLDADGAAVVPQARAEEVLAASLEREERERVKRAKLQAGALSYDLDDLRERVREPDDATSPTSTTSSCSPPSPSESLRLFDDVLGMEEESREGQSVFLRGWGEYQRYWLKLTESAAVRPRATWRCARGAPRRSSAGSAAIEAAGLGIGWIDGDHGHGPAYRFTDPDGHVMEVYFETGSYVRAGAPAPVAEQPAAALHRPRRRGQAPRPRQPARARRRRQPRLRRGRARLPPLRGHRARRRHARPAPG